MNRKLKIGKQEKGFTIIEVLIVLAIAGLIILIVFLAVPALQRNSRNTQRKNDVSALLGSVSEHISNNSGTLPTAAQVEENVNLQYYTFGNIAQEGSWNLFPAQPTPMGNVTNSGDRAAVITGARCQDNGQAIRGPARGFVVLYGTENSNGIYTLTCQAS